jgi:hypothetical protein
MVIGITHEGHRVKGGCVVSQAQAPPLPGGNHFRPSHDMLLRADSERAA